jgi:tetratricopeptide (TPR) repeat protein
MSAPPHVEQQADATAPKGRWPLSALRGALHWAAGSRRNMAISAVAGLMALAATFAAWSYVAHLAVESLKPPSIEMALAALDAGQFEEARTLIGDMQSFVATPQLVGGAMFVLGAVKAHEADQETSTERRSGTYQVAARYLRQAHAQEIPDGRDAQAAYLTGKSLVLSGQGAAGLPMLEQALAGKPENAAEIHALIVMALLSTPGADLNKALAHNEQVIADESLVGVQRDEALLLRAETLMRLDRMADAESALAQIARDGPFEGRRLLLAGRVHLAAAETLPAGSADQRTRLEAANKQFAAAQRIDADSGPVLRQAAYWSARCLELLDDHASALAQYIRLSNLYGDTNEGLAAALALADDARRQGETARAVAGYRAVIAAVGNPQTYDNPLAPLSKIRELVRDAHNQFLGEDQYGPALSILDFCEPVMGRAECMELRARAHQEWGVQRREQSEAEGGEEGEKLSQEGRFHLRAAGRAYEDLARIRFATLYFTRDLWQAGDCYFQGQGYSNAARVFKEFLHHEARKNNDLALVRIGQSRLALSDYAGAVGALEECIELYPEGALTHQARLEAARAYRQLGKFDEAERLLRDNLTAKALTPQSPEWRDSQFELGHLMYDSQRYADSIALLSEAVNRYPEHESATLSKYTVARAYHNSAESLAERLRAPAAENEAQTSRNRKQIAEDLENAYATYVEVQEEISLSGKAESDPLLRGLLRNCFMMQGSVLIELKRFEEARHAYQNIITLYQNDPVVLESFVQVANCWRRLDQPEMARGNLERAKVVLSKLPPEADFLASTNFNRQEWEVLLDQMSRW